MILHHEREGQGEVSTASASEADALRLLADEVLTGLAKPGNVLKLREWESPYTPQTNDVILQPRWRLIRGAVDPALSDVRDLTISRRAGDELDVTLREFSTGVHRSTQVTLNPDFSSVVAYDEETADRTAPRVIGEADLLDTGTCGELKVLLDGLRNQLNR